MRCRLAIVTWSLFCIGSAFGQPPEALTDPLGLPGEPPPKVTARLVADSNGVEPGKPFTIAVAFDVPKGTYFYYRSGGSFGLPTKVNFTAPAGYQIGGSAFPTPDIKHEKVGEQDSVHYIYRRNTAVLATVMPPGDLKLGETAHLSAKVSYQYCLEGGVCFPPEPQALSLDLPIVGESKPSDAVAIIDSARNALPVRGDASKYAKVHAVLSQDKLRPGDSAQLAVVIDVEKGYHIQMHQPPVKQLISTEVVFEETPGIEKVGKPIYPAGDVLENPPIGFEGVREYRGRVVVRVPIVASQSLTGPIVTLSGFVRYQACLDGGACFQPIAASFAITIPIAAVSESVATVQPELFRDTSVSSAPGDGTSHTKGSRDKLTDARDLFSSLQLVEANSSEQSLFVYVLWAFLGGLILNIMPCVLPVIAIKVLSFVKQSGESRGHVFLLNIAYSAGVISVFLALATMAVTAGLGWGGLFQRAEFNLFMAGLVFAMGLSLLGVFEIPIPGMIGSGADHKEGLIGAYITGIFATLLATPCSGPFLGVTLGWSVRQTPGVTYLVWGTMGLGMAFPYLLFGMFPACVRWLPRPGNWMVRFKEFSGLVLMGTVVWIITFLDETYTLPCLVMLVGLSLGFWMIGNLYDFSSPIRHKTAVRLAALALSGLICLFGLTYMKNVAEYRRDRRTDALREQVRRELHASGAAFQSNARHSDTELPWQPFSEERLKEVLSHRKTALVDFTADW